MWRVCSPRFGTRHEPGASSCGDCRISRCRCLARRSGPAFLFWSCCMNTIATIPLSALKKPAALSNARWRVEDVEALFALPLMDLLHRAQQVHRQHFDPNEIQLSTLLSIKTGGCCSDCADSPQTAHVFSPVEGRSARPDAAGGDGCPSAKD